MNIFIIVFLVTLALVCILMIVAAFAPKEYFVSREISIEKPRMMVFEYLRFLKNQDDFSKWALMDPFMKKDYSGTDGKTGFISSWESSIKGVGRGSQEIKNVISGERIDILVRFIKPFPGNANVSFMTESISLQETKVIWNFKSRMKFPSNLMLLFYSMDKMIGNDLDTGLINLKCLLEK